MILRLTKVFEDFSSTDQIDGLRSLVTWMAASVALTFAFVIVIVIVGENARNGERQKCEGSTAGEETSQEVTSTRRDVLQHGLKVVSGLFSHH